MVVFTVFILFFIVLISRGPVPDIGPVFEKQGKFFFDAEKKMLAGYLLYEPMVNIDYNPSYKHTFKEENRRFYRFKTYDRRQQLLLISINKHNNINSISTEYIYPDFESCNKAVDSIYADNKEFFNPDGTFQNSEINKTYFFNTYCRLEHNKTIHFTHYYAPMRIGNN